MVSTLIGRQSCFCDGGDFPIREDITDIESHLFRALPIGTLTHVLKSVAFINNNKGGKIKLKKRRTVQIRRDKKNERKDTEVIPQDDTVVAAD